MEPHASHSEMRAGIVGSTQAPCAVAPLFNSVSVCPPLPLFQIAAEPALEPHASHSEMRAGTVGSTQVPSKPASRSAWGSSIVERSSEAPRSHHGPASLLGSEISCSEHTIAVIENVKKDLISNNEHFAVTVPSGDLANAHVVPLQCSKNMKGTNSSPVCHNDSEHWFVHKSGRAKQIVLEKPKETPAWILRGRGKQARNAQKRRQSPLQQMTEKDSGQQRQKRRDLEQTDCNRAELEDIQDFNAALRNYKLVVCECCRERCEFTTEIKSHYAKSDPIWTALLAERTFTFREPEASHAYLCHTCFKDLASQTVPRFAFVNGFDFGEVPEEIRALNSMELRMIKRIIPFVTVFQPQAGALPFTKNNCVSFVNDVASFVNKLPRPPDDTAVLYASVPARDNKPQRFFEISAHRIRAALYKLKQINKRYADVEIDEQMLTDIEQGKYENVVTVQLRADQECEPTGDDDEWVDEQNDVNDVSRDKEDVPTDDICSDSESDQPVPSADSAPEELFDEASEVWDEHFVYDPSMSSQALTKELERMVTQARVIDLPEHTNDQLVPPRDYRDDDALLDAFVEVFPYGRGGPNSHRLRELKDNRFHDAYYSHLLRLDDRRFVQNSQFVFFVLNTIQRERLCAVSIQAELANELQDSTWDSLVDHIAERTARDDILQSPKKFATYLKHIVKPYMQKVPVSPLYWSKLADDLQRIIDAGPMLPVPVPSWFVTLTAADLHWLDIARILHPELTEGELRNIPSRQRFKDVVDNPDVVARYLYFRLETFFKYVLKGHAKPLGEIVDEWWRAESQGRGQLHFHILLWSALMFDANKLLQSPEGRTELAARLERIIDCTGPKENGTIADFKRGSVHPSKQYAVEEPLSSAAAQDDLAQLKSVLQIHNHGPVCKKRGHKHCRFEYPRKQRTEPVVGISVRYGSKRLRVRTTRKNRWLVEANPTLLRAWRANINVQFCGDPRGAAVYTAYYASKNEEGSPFAEKLLEALSTDTIRSTTVRKALQTMTSLSLKYRSVSIEEAVWILLGLPMHHSSRSVTSICVISQHEKILTSEGLCDNKHTRRERLYAARPVELQNICFAEFVAHYSVDDRTSGDKSFDRIPPNRELSDGTLLPGVVTTTDAKTVRLRPKMAVLNPFPFVATDAANESYCKVLLQLYVPWTGAAADQLLLPNETAVSAVKRIMPTLPTRLQDIVNHLTGVSEARKKIVITTQQDAMECDEEGSFASDEDASDEDEEINHSAEHATDTHRSEEYAAAAVFIKEQEHKLKADRAVIVPDRERTHERITQSLLQLNVKQAECVAEYLASVRDDKQLQMIVAGPGGTGKSFLINILRDITNYLFPPDERFSGTEAYPQTMVVSHMGVVAVANNGTTLHKAARLKCAMDHKYTPATIHMENPLKLIHKWEPVKLIIVDECYTVGPNELGAFNARLQLAKENHAPFGGISVIFMGDPAQLPPVRSTTLFCKSLPASENTNLLSQSGLAAWKQIDRVVYLDTPMRQRNAEEFALLNRARTNTLNTDDWELLRSRVATPAALRTTLMPSDHVTWVLARWKEVQDKNNEYLERMSHEKLITVWASHRTSQRVVRLSVLHNTDDQQVAFRTALLTEEAEKDRHRQLVHKLDLKIGCRVRLTENISIPLHLINGATGTLYKLITVSGVPFCTDLTADEAARLDTEGKYHVPIALVAFDKQYYTGSSFIDTVDRVVPIVPSTARVQITTVFGKAEYMRYQLPLVVNGAATIHSCQGQTLQHVVTNINHMWECGQAYVAVSRVHTLSDLHLTEAPADPTMAKNFAPKPTVFANICAEDNRLKRLDVDRHSSAQTNDVSQLWTMLTNREACRPCSARAAGPSAQ